MTVFVARRSPECPDAVVELLSDAGVNVLGPVTTAKEALLLAAQSPIDLALVEPELAGVRDGRELARRLEDTWGIRAILMDRG